jgi:hypothetical protein
MKLPMKLPSVLWFGYHPVQIVRKSDDATDGGYYNDANREIFVAADVARHEQALAFLHELVHLFIAEHDIALDSETEERIADAVSRGFAEVMSRNSGLLETVRKSL